MKSFRTHLNELSKKTLGSYIKRASSVYAKGSISNLATTARGFVSLAKTDDKFNQPYWNSKAQEYSQKSVNRSHRIRKAVDRLTKEEVVDESKTASWNNFDEFQKLKTNTNRRQQRSWGRAAKHWGFDPKTGKKEKPFRDAAVTGNPRDFANEEVANEMTNDSGRTSTDYVPSQPVYNHKVGDRVSFMANHVTGVRIKKYGRIIHDHGDGRVNIDTNNPLTRTKSYPSTVHKSQLVKEHIGHIHKGAFHAWLGKSPDAKITAADIRRGLRAGGHAAEMARFAHNIGHVGESVDLEESWGFKVGSFKEFQHHAQSHADCNTHDGKCDFETKEVGHELKGTKPWHQTSAIVTYQHKQNQPYIIGTFNHKSKGSDEGHGQTLGYGAVREEVVNELSAKTMGDYVSNASTDLANQAAKAGRFFGTVHPERFKAQRKVDKRVLGIKKATQKIRKEEVVNEVSPRKLVDYMAGAASSMASNSFRMGQISGHAVHGNGKYEGEKELRAKQDKRVKGITKAHFRLAHPEMYARLLKKKKTNEEVLDENFADWREKLEKGSREGNEVQFKIKNSGGRTEAYKNGKKIGSYDHNKRMGIMGEEVVSEDQDFSMDKLTSHVHLIDKPAYLDKNKKRDQRRSFKKKFDAVRDQRKFQ